MAGAWVHHCRMQCDSGLELNHLQEFYFIALDVFQKSGYAKSRNKDDRLAGWLSLLCTEDADVAEELCLTYPWLEEIYREMAAYRLKPEEVLGMFSDALREMDRNTVKYMVEQQQKTIQDQAAKLEEKETLLSEKDTLLSEKDTLLSEKDAEISEKIAMLSEKEILLDEKDAMLSEKDLLLSQQAREIERLKQMLGKNNMLHEDA